MNHPTVLNEKLHSVANCQGVLFCSFYSTSFTFFFPLKKSCGSSNIACSFLPRFLWGNSLKRRLLVRSRSYPLPSPSCPLLIIQPIIGCNGCDLKVPLVKGLIQRSYLDASLRVEHDLKHQGQRELAASHSEEKPWCLPASGWASMLLSIIFRRVLKSSTHSSLHSSAKMHSLPQPESPQPRELPKQNKEHAASHLGGDLKHRSTRTACSKGGCMELKVLRRPPEETLRGLTRWLRPQCH